MCWPLRIARAVTGSESMVSQLTVNIQFCKPVIPLPRSPSQTDALAVIREGETVRYAPGI